MPNTQQAALLCSQDICVPLLPVRDSIPHRVIKAEFAFPDLVKERWLAFIVKGWVAAQKDEEHHASTPQIYCGAVYQPRRSLHTPMQLTPVWIHTSDSWA